MQETATSQAPPGKNLPFKKADLPKIRQVEVPENLIKDKNMIENQSHYYIPATMQTIQWGYFSKKSDPLLRIKSGDLVTMEVVTQQACDCYDSMIQGDIGLESIFHWEKGYKTVSRRGPGPHICTGPIYIEEAQPGDVIEVKILDMQPRYCKSPYYQDRFLGVNVAATWGYQHNRRADGKNREVVTIFEIFNDPKRCYAKALYSHKWGPYTDPDGKVHETWDYPGLLAGPQDSSHIKMQVLKGVEVPLRPHFGVLGLAPAEIDEVSTTAPGHFGGNIDNWRIGKGGIMYYPVGVEGGLLSAADAHAAQGDSECNGTAIESSWTGTFQIILHKKATTQKIEIQNLDYPLLETDTEWIIHGFSYPNYLKSLGKEAYKEQLLEKATLDGAFKDAYYKAREFIMRTQDLTEDETVALLSVAVDFVVTQVVDANMGVHAIIKKGLFGH